MAESAKAMKQAQINDFLTLYMQTAGTANPHLPLRVAWRLGGARVVIDVVRARIRRRLYG